MRKVLHTLFIALFSLTVIAQTAVTTNKIIENGKEYYLHEVQASEGFMAIGRQYGVAYKVIIDANPEAVSEGLQVGKIIRIPITKGRNSSDEEIKSDDFLYHIVEAGQTIFFISRKYNVSYKDIIEHNPEAADVLSIGMELKIPKKGTPSTTPLTNTSLSTTPQIEQTPSAPVTTAGNAQEDDKYTYHTVKPQETAYSIARKYNISLTELLTSNPGLEVNDMPIGTKLRILESSITKEDNINQQLKDTEYTYYRIKSDDTLESISKQFDIPAKVILQANNLDKDLPPVNYLLKIPHAYQFNVETVNQQIYVVKKKDDIRHIAETYQVPIMDIQKVNPQVKKWTKLKKGTKLIIPTLSVEVVEGESNQVSQQEQAEEDLTKYMNEQSSEMSDTITVAFVWPLYLELNDTLNINTGHATTQQLKSIYPLNSPHREFFFSSLMALNDLKDKGYKTKIKVYDAKRGFQNMTAILDDPTLAEADIIIGTQAKDYVTSLAKFCHQNKIRLILPFTSKCSELANNPYIYQVGPTAAITYSQIAQKVSEQYVNSNIIVVKGTINDERERLFIENLKFELYNPDSLSIRMISYNEVNFNKDQTSGLTSLIRPDKHNLIIIPDKKEKIGTLVIPVIDNYAKRHDEVDVKLLGFAEWQQFELKEMENIFNIGCDIYTPFYADPYSEEAELRNYVESYYEYFNEYPTNVYPYYGMLGYDVMTYFITGLEQYGNMLEKNLDKIIIDGLCVDLNFERVNSWGGFSNTTIYNIELTEDFDVILKK